MRDGMIVRAVALTVGVSLSMVGVPAAAGPQFISDAPLPARELVERLVRGGFEMRLRDAESARYRFGQTFRVSCRKNVFKTPERWTGWGIDFAVNAKNAYGAYAGFEPYVALLVNDGTSEGVAVYDPGFLQRGACRREPG